MANDTLEVPLNSSIPIPEFDESSVSAEASSSVVSNGEGTTGVAAANVTRRRLDHIEEHTGTSEAAALNASVAAGGEEASLEGGAVVATEGEGEKVEEIDSAAE